MVVQKNCPPSSAMLTMLSFVGRHTELSDLHDLLINPACRLITLVGPGGIGKTRLAYEITARYHAIFADGAVFVPLQSVASADFLVTAIAAALPLPLQGQDDLPVQLLTAIREREMLLVLDTFEHLLDGIDLLVAILNNALNVKLLVTSREVLNIQDEWLYPLRALGVPSTDTIGDLSNHSAVVLFAERARQMCPDFRLEHQQEAVIRICQLVDGLPLALELAAAWTRTLSCATIADEIARNLTFLQTTRRDVPERHRSIQAIFKQSWTGLHSEVQIVFARLALFQGGFSREAAEQVAGATLPLLALLIDKSLVQRDTDGRYQIHALLRQFAEQQIMTLTDEANQVRQAYAQYYVRFLQIREAAILSASQRDVLEAIAVEISNIRVAWQWIVTQADIDAIAQAEHTLAKYYQFHGFYQEGSEMLASTLPCLRKADPSQATDMTLASILVDMALLNIRLGRMDTARAAFAESQELYVRHTMPPRPGCSTDPRIGLSEISLYTGNYTEAIHLATAAFHTNQAHGHQINLLESLHMLVSAYRLQGEYAMAQIYASRLIDVARSIQHRYVLAYCFNALGTLCYALEDYNGARHYLQSAYTLTEEVPNLQVQALSLLLLGKVAFLQVQYPEAEELFHRSLAIFQDTGDQSNTASALAGLGFTACANSRYEEARRLFTQSLQLANVQYISLTLWILTGISEWLLQAGYPEQGCMLFAFILRHPASDDQTKRQATGLRERFEAMLAPAYTASIEQGHILDLDTAFTQAQVALTLPLRATNPGSLAPYPHRLTETSSATETGFFANRSVEASQIEPLTPREREVLGLIREGLTNQAIAEQLVLSVGTIRWYAQQIYAKLGVKSRTQALARAREYNLLA